MAQKRRRRKLNKKRIAIIVSVCGVLYLCVLFVQQSFLIASIESQKENVQAQIDQTVEEGQGYLDEISRIGDDSYIEQEARDKLGMTKEGDIEFVAGE